MTIYYVFVDEDTDRRLKKIARELERSVEDLCESAVAEAARNHDRRDQV